MAETPSTILRIPTRKLRPRDGSPATLVTIKAGSAALVELTQPRRSDNVDGWLGVIHAVDAVAVKIMVFQRRVVTSTRIRRRTHRQANWRELREPGLVVVPWPRISAILVAPDKPRGGHPEDIVHISEVRAVAERVSA